MPSKETLAIFNLQFPIYNQCLMSQFSRSYDLELRTGKFGEDVIKLCQDVTQDSITNPIIRQLIRSATSVGANYAEANGASSRKDFRNKIFICKKEAQETKHWLRMLIVASPTHRAMIEPLGQECQELVLIFQKIGSSLSQPQLKHWEFNEKCKIGNWKLTVLATACCWSAGGTNVATTRFLRLITTVVAKRRTIRVVINYWARLGCLDRFNHRLF